MTLQEHYNAIKNGKGNKAQFLKHARTLFPEYFNQYSDFDTATNVLKSKQIISEAAGGVVAKGFSVYDWKKILGEEVKAEEKNVSKEVLDAQAHMYDNKDMKNADNINFNEIMKGFYAELKDEKNKNKTGDEVKAIVVKNLAKDPLYYTKDGMFGEKGVGYTTEAPGLGTPKEPKGKFKASGYGDIDAKTEKVKANVQDSLGDKEAKTSMPSKVKEMPVASQNASGVKKMPTPGAEKKIKLKEALSSSQLSQYANMSDQEIINWAKEDGMEDFIEYDELGQLSNHDELLAYLLGKEVDDDLDNNEEDMWGPDDIDPAGGRGLSSHMEESKEQSLKERIAAMVREILSEDDIIDEGEAEDKAAADAAKKNAAAQTTAAQTAAAAADAAKKAADSKAKEVASDKNPGIPGAGG